MQGDTMVGKAGHTQPPDLKQQNHDPSPLARVLK
jgi:hypothetical protein